MHRHFQTAALCLVFSFLVGVGVAQADNQSGIYPFAIEPLQIFDRLNDFGNPHPFPDDEREFLQAAWNNRSKEGRSSPAVDHTLLRAFWYASGVTESNSQDQYSLKFEALFRDAKKAIGNTADSREKAEKLLHFLHDGIMAGGYDFHESTLHAVFDQKKYNCVSSSAVYYLLGTRLGLNLQVILIPGDFTPGHAAVDLIDGSERIQIEPTNKEGFDWPAKKQRPGFVSIGVEPDRSKAYDSDVFGLAASIASNLGVTLGKNRQETNDRDQQTAIHCEIIRWYVLSLCLDPHNGTGATNLLSELSNWGLQEANNTHYESAVKVYDHCRQIAPDDSTVRNNTEFVWSEYIESEIEAGREVTALKTIARAAAALPDHPDFQKRAEWFIRAGTKANRNWEDSLAMADRADKILSDQTDLKEIRNWRTTLFRLRSQELLQAGDVDGSLIVLARAANCSIDERELHEGLEYHLQRAFEKNHSLGGAKLVTDHFRKVIQQFPKEEKAADEMVNSHVRRLTDGLVKLGHFDEAIRQADEYKEIVGKSDDDIRAWIYDGWAKSLYRAQKQEEALEKYTDGLKALPGNQILKGNGTATVIQWSKASMNKKDWEEAIRIYETGLKYFPDESSLKNNKQYCEANLKKQ